MKILRFCILLVAAAIVASVFTGCAKESNTLATVTVTPANQYMVKGTTQQFIATGTFTNGMTLLWSQVVEWSIDSTATATITNVSGSFANGLVYAVDYGGPAVITAHDVANNITGTATVTVADPDPVLTIQPTRPYMSIGAVSAFSAIASFTIASGGTVTQTIGTYTQWTSSTPGLVTIVDTPGIFGNGIITANTVTGTTDIKAVELFSGASGTTTLTITSTPMASIVIEQVNPTIISMNTTTQFTAVGTFTDGSTTKTLTPGVDASWHWTSSNTAVATIDFYTGLATAIALGDTIIVARDPITGLVSAAPVTLRIQ